MRNLVYLFIAGTTYLYGAEACPAVAVAKDIQINEDSGKVRITISTDAVQYNDFVLHNPERIVVDLKETSCHLPSNKPVNIAPVVSIRAGQYARAPSPITRVVIDLASRAASGFSVAKITDGICIDIPKASATSEEQVPESSQVKENVATSKKEPQGSEITPPWGKIALPIKPPKGLKTAKVSKTEVIAKPAKQRAGGEEKNPPKDTVTALHQVSLQDNSVVYASRGKRDPFRPWLGVEGTGSEDSLLNIYNATIVGIMWSPKEKYALAQDLSGKGFILSEGDRVANGKVELIDKAEVSFALYGFGGVKRVTLKLLTKEEREKVEKEKEQRGK